MPDVWMPGLIHDPGRGAGYAAGRNRMFMVVDHNTGGTNSYQVCKDGRPGYDTGLCQILLPKVGVPWQFTEIDAICYHAGSAQYGDYNPYGPGFEVERLSLDEPLSDDQAMWLGRINAWLEVEWNVPNVHYWGPQFAPWQANFHGHVNHSQIHPNPDGLTQAEWDRITRPAPAPEEEDDMPISYIANKDDPSVGIFVTNEVEKRHVTVTEWDAKKYVAALEGKVLTFKKLPADWFNSIPTAP